MNKNDSKKDKVVRGPVNKTLFCDPSCHFANWSRCPGEQLVDKNGRINCPFLKGTKHDDFSNKKND